MTKQNVVFHKNKTVSFEEHRIFAFDSVNSVNSEDLNITMINVLLMVSSNAMRETYLFRSQNKVLRANRGEWTAILSNNSRSRERDFNFRSETSENELEFIQEGAMVVVAADEVESFPR